MTSISIALENIEEYATRLGHYPILLKECEALRTRITALEAELVAMRQGHGAAKQSATAAEARLLDLAQRIQRELDQVAVPQIGA